MRSLRGFSNSVLAVGALALALASVTRLCASPSAEASIEGVGARPPSNASPRPLSAERAAALRVKYSGRTLVELRQAFDALAMMLNIEWTNVADQLHREGMYTFQQLETGDDSAIRVSGGPFRRITAKFDGFRQVVSLDDQPSHWLWDVWYESQWLAEQIRRSSSTTYREE